MQLKKVFKSIIGKNKTRITKVINLEDSQMILHYNKK